MLSKLRAFGLWYLIGRATAVSFPMFDFDILINIGLTLIPVLSHPYSKLTIGVNVSLNGRLFLHTALDGLQSHLCCNSGRFNESGVKY